VFQRADLVLFDQEFDVTDGSTEAGRIDADADGLISPSPTLSRRTGLLHPLRRRAANEPVARRRK